LTAYDDGKEKTREKVVLIKNRTRGYGVLVGYGGGVGVFDRQIKTIAPGAIPQ